MFLLLIINYAPIVIISTVASFEQVLINMLSLKHKSFSNSYGGIVVACDGLPKFFVYYLIFYLLTI